MIFKSKAIVFCIFLFVPFFSTFVSANDFKGTNLSSDALPYDMPPFTFEGCRILSITFKTSPEVLRAIVPEQLTPNSDGTMMILVANHHVTHPVEFSYYESILAVPVSDDNYTGIYLPVLYLDKVMPILGGRETHGYHKIDAEIQMSIVGGKASASVIRNGTTLIDLTAQLGEPVDPVPEMPMAPMFNLKLIPSVQKGAPPDVKQLTRTVATDVKTHVVRVGSGKLELGSLPSDPLGAIPVVEILSAGYEEQDFVLGYGEVVYDYLRQ